MKMSNKMRFTSLTLTLLIVVMMTVPTISMAAQQTVNLGTTSSFAVLAGSTITNTGTTVINGDAGGDVGLHPGTAFTGENSTTISGSVHLADEVSQRAKDDLVKAYNDAAGRTEVTIIGTELGGATLTPGVYASADGTFQITGTLTLDAQGDPDGVFIFKTASTLITASNSNIELKNSARFCRTFWQVGSSATLGVDSHFVGHIFAMQSITANTYATIQGQLLAMNGAVTLDNNTITNGICEDTPVDSTPVETEEPIEPEEPVETEEPIEPEEPVETEEPIKPEVPVEVTPVDTEEPMEEIPWIPIEDNAIVVVETPVVTPPVPDVKLPKTSADIYKYTPIGIILLIIGSIGWKSKKHYE